MKRNTFDDFWKLVSKPRFKNNCWIWKGIRGPFKKQYGRFKMNCKWFLAHRLSYVFYNGEIPPNMQILHKCDNPPCVNPHHLFLGTQLDNMHDMIAKGRKVTGHKQTLKTRLQISNNLKKFFAIKRSQLNELNTGANPKA